MKDLWGPEGHSLWMVMGDEGAEGPGAQIIGRLLSLSLEASLCWILQHEWVERVLRVSDKVPGRGTSMRSSGPQGRAVGRQQGTEIRKK